MKHATNTAASGPGRLVCPHCELGRIRFTATSAGYCGRCGRALTGVMLENLREIATLPEALGHHACECGHPEMRRLPDGVFHCPACGSEVLPATVSTQRVEGTANHTGAVRGREGEGWS